MEDLQMIICQNYLTKSVEIDKFFLVLVHQFLPSLSCAWTELWAINNADEQLAGWRIPRLRFGELQVSHALHVAFP